MNKPIAKGKRKTKNPCPRCQTHMSRCICAHIPHLDLRTRISLVIHTHEVKRTTNTGRLAHEALKNSALLIKGDSRERLDLSGLILPEYQNCLLYPAEDAIDIGELETDKPVHLIVADGNWRQASKINTRHPELAALPRVKISQRNRAAYHLRKEHFEEGLSTLEAIAMAIASLEGEPAAEPLRALYRAKLSATLQGRGVKMTAPLFLVR